jgi:hypothetical protein
MQGLEKHGAFWHMGMNRINNMLERYGFENKVENGRALVLLTELTATSEGASRERSARAFCTIINVRPTYRSTGSVVGYDSIKKICEHRLKLLHLC